MGRSMGHWHWQWRPSRAADRLPLLRWPRADRQAAALHSPAAPVSMCNERLYYRKYHLWDMKKKTLVREDVSLRVPIDGRRSSSRHDGQGDLKESQQSEPEASSRVHSLVFFFFSLLLVLFLFFSPLAELTTNKKKKKRKKRIRIQYNF